jgi:periplasmic protein TonB
MHEIRQPGSTDPMRYRINVAASIAVLALAGCAEPPPESPPRQLPGSHFHYPEELWDAGVEGETLLEIHVSETGGVDSARVERTSGHAEFDSAAVAGARDLRFEPARRGENSVSVRVLLPVQFHLPARDTAPGDTATADAAPEPTAEP